MNLPPRWQEQTDLTPARELVALAASVQPIPVQPTTWDDLMVRAAVSPPGPRLLPSFAASVMVGVLLVLGSQAVLNAARVPEAPAPSPVLMASTSARWRQEPDGLVVLEAGRLVLPAKSAQLIRVKTPHLTVEARTSRFLAEVVVNGTVVVVEEGDVVVRMGRQERHLLAGESLTWPSAPLVPQNLLVRPTELGCAQAPPDQRRACLEREAQGADLTAEAALYEVGALALREGRHAEARAAWHSSLERFGDGVLHPEVRLALLVEQVRERDFAGAQQTAREFERACPDDARLPEVRSLRLALEALR